MSYSPPPPPPPPFPPMQPIPVQPLQYNLPTYSRPGILSAIGVVSIIVASLSLLVSGIMGLTGFSMLMASQTSRAMTMSTSSTSSSGSASVTAGTGAAATPAAPAAPEEEDLEQDGMPRSDRAVLVSTLAELRNVTPARQKQLDALLAKAGKRILPMTGPALTRRSIAANLTDAGQFPAGHKGPGADFFVFGRGRVEVSDDHAVFYPSGTGEVVRASAVEEEAPSDTDPGSAAPTPPVASPQTSPPGPRTALTDAEVRAVIARIQRLSGQKLNAAQASVIGAQLKTPGQQIILIGPGQRVSPPAQVVSATWVSGSIFFTTTSANMSVQPSGALTLTSFGGAGGRPVFPNVTLQATLALIGTVLQLLLAVLLLVAGILVIRNSLRGRQLHLIYASLKLPIAIATGIAWGWFWWSLSRGLGAGAMPAQASWTLLIIFAVPAALGLVYPVALLIAMNTARVRDYYITR